MKATLEVNEEIIKRAILEYFKKMDADKVTLRARQNEDMYGHQIGHTISAEVQIEVGEVVAH